MKRTAIVFQSKYGATRTYATWLAEELSADLFEAKKVSAKDLAPYDVIVFGGAVYASGVPGFSVLRKLYPKLADKHILAFIVGASPYQENQFAQVSARVFKDTPGDIPCFYCCGTWVESKMGFKDKALVALLKKAVAGKSGDDFEPWEVALIEASGSDHDWTDKRYLDPIVAEARNTA